MLDPGGSTISAVAVSAAASGKVRSSWVSAAAAGAPGIVKLSLYLPPTVSASTPSSTRTPAQMAKTRR